MVGAAFLFTIILERPLNRLEKQLDNAVLPRDRNCSQKSRGQAPPDW